MRESTDRMSYSYSRIKGKILFIILLSAVFSSPVLISAQENEQSEEMLEENIDDLFNTPEEDILVENTEQDHLTQFEESEKVIFKGNFSAKAGGGFGWNKMPDLSDPGSGLSPVYGADSRISLSFDARPDPTLRIYGRGSTEIAPDESSKSWTDPEIDEMFGDYNWLDKAYIRIGKYRVKWGQGRIFTPGDLIEESDDGVTVRATLPTIFDGISAVAFYDDSFTGTDEKLSGEDLAYAFLADKTFGDINFSAGARYRQGEKLRTLNSFKTVVFGTDLFSDVVIHFDEEDPPLFEVLGGFFKEWTDLRLYGEYCLDASEENYDDHSMGLAAGYKNIFSTSLDFGIEWQHAFIDDSGSIITGVTWKPWKNVKASVGIPFIYGSDNSRYVDDNDSPVDSRAACIFFLELSSSF